VDATYFDRLTRSLAASSSRRLLLRGLALLGLVAVEAPHATLAKKRRKKLNFNEFGCVNVGGKCRGKDAVCCSGICEGKKPKKGKRDRSRCVGHDTGTGCVAGQVEPFCLSDEVINMGLGSEGDPNCTTSTGGTGVCNTTTGNAPYCTNDGVCFPCSKDTDCQSPSVCDQAAACIRCAGGCPETGGTMCVGPSFDSCLD
jgi:hypothetical protein